MNFFQTLLTDSWEFTKVRLGGEEGYIFGRRSSGYFDVRRLDGQKLSAGVSFKKLHLLEKRKTYLTVLLPRLKTKVSAP